MCGLEALDKERLGLQVRSLVQPLKALRQNVVATLQRLEAAPGEAAIDVHQGPGLSGLGADLKPHLFDVPANDRLRILSDAAA